MKHRFTIVQSDWINFHQPQDDRRRFRRKMKEIIHENLSDLIGEESIMNGEGKTSASLRTSAITESKIRFAGAKQFGMGDGDTKPGDAFEGGGTEIPSILDGGSSGPSREAGVDFLEQHVTIEEIEEALLSELELPDVEKKGKASLATKEEELRAVGHVGTMANLDKRQTLKEAITRHARNGRMGFPVIGKEDLRFRQWEEEETENTAAVVIAMMDTSGSMGTWEKYMARTFLFWTKRFLDQKYEQVDICYIAHDVAARVVEEDHFFHKGSGGGTICSSAYKKAMEVITSDYPPDEYNIFLFHLTDGDNLTSDNRRTVKLVEQLNDVCQMVNYVEINQYNRHSTLMSAFRYVPDATLKKAIIKGKNDIYRVLKQIFKKG